VPLGIGLLGALTIWIATPQGIGVEYDSVIYWSAAENLLAGRGLGRVDGSGEFIPLTHYPPLYPLVLAAAAQAISIPVTAAARAVSAGLFGVNLALIERIVRGLGPGRETSIGASLVCLLAPTVLDRHLWLMSEPLYFTWLLLALVGLARALDEAGVRWVAASAAATGLAILTRYAGISLLATGVSVLLALRIRPLGDRLRSSVLFALLAGALPMLWQVRNLLITGTPSNRVLLFHPPTLERLREGGSTVAAWLPISVVSAELRFAAVAALALWACVALIRRAGGGREASESPAWRLATLSAIHASVYLGFLGVSLTFFDAATRLSDRILSPLFLSAVLMAASLLVLQRAMRSRAVRFAALGGVVLLSLGYASLSASRVVASRQGLGFVSPSWRESETIALVRGLPAGLRLYSNEAFPIYFLTGRLVSWVPERVDPVKGAERVGYRDQLAAMRAKVAAGSAALILVHPESLRPELPALEELTGGWQPTSRASDGWIFLGDAGS
jgi:4-amino-4-deoxy-L-arabinose transferase-like glycosyltransferase